MDEFIIYKSIMIAKSYADAQLMEMAMQNARWFQRALGAFTWPSVASLTKLSEARLARRAAADRAYKTKAAQQGQAAGVSSV
ncbi:MAG: hypothetical protein U1E47_09595 [Rivihabitans pingtungensis]|uniref:hypothetical protein n=1 Tax=Rivihabitans pingtungensis TaxID=1054498 RepID=UPI002CEF78A9|nr:hypothetical protein [Rivihabitans pingtungensis]HNX70127.1 hypothetical protein [Rivihabitans pingtungensis]